jgi:hypothetical protein
MSPLSDPILRPFATGRNGCSRWCVGHSNLADRAMVRLNEEPKRCRPIIYTPNAARLVRKERLDGGPFKIAEFVAHDPSLQFRSLKHVSGSAINPIPGGRVTNALNLLPFLFQCTPDVKGLAAGTTGSRMTHTGSPAGVALVMPASLSQYVLVCKTVDRNTPIGGGPPRRWTRSPTAHGRNL